MELETMISENENGVIIPVLGTDYTMRLARPEDSKRIEGKCGFCDPSVKEIVIRSEFGDDDDNLKDLKSFQQSVIRHELIHAFLCESGLYDHCDWAATEECVDWFAMQFNKITDAIHNAYVLLDK